MYSLTADSIGEAHEKVVRLIMQGNDFNDVLTEDKEQTFEYPEPVNIHVRTPLKEPMASRYFQFGQRALEKYTEEILCPRPLADRPGKPDFSYLYSNLIWDYPWGRMHPANPAEPRAMWERGNGHGTGLNQIAYVVEKLIKTPTSRRAVASLFVPVEHENMDDPPCLNHIQFLLRNGELNMHALFRSNDMLSAWGANAYALAYLQRDVLARINGQMINKPDACDCIYTIGWLETTSISAHIYFARDHSELQKFKGFY